MIILLICIILMVGGHFVDLCKTKDVTMTSRACFLLCACVWPIDGYNYKLVIGQPSLALRRHVILISI